MTEIQVFPSGHTKKNRKRKERERASGPLRGAALRLRTASRGPNRDGVSDQLTRSAF